MEPPRAAADHPGRKARVHLSIHLPPEVKPLPEGPTGTPTPLPRSTQETATVVLITAGPTQEPIDAVRYIANRSSGRMGIAVAEASAARGRRTTLLLGPTPLRPIEHSRLTTIRFRTTADLQALLAEHWPGHGVLVMAAAVADYRPARREDAGGKRRRTAGAWSLQLEPTPDLLAELAPITRPDQVTIGFALEPAEELAAAARAKLAAKGVDAVVANPLETMGSDVIRATLILRDGRALTPPKAECTKRDFAEWLLDQLPKLSRKA
jgi:phosphopantothenoylcysteine decarboxylase/phosphopantothenate--cysteine ligase